MERHSVEVVVMNIDGETNTLGRELEKNAIRPPLSPQNLVPITVLSSAPLQHLQPDTTIHTTTVIIIIIIITDTTVPRYTLPRSPSTSLSAPDR